LSKVTPRPDREPDLIVRVGKSVAKVYGPGPMTDEERKIIDRNIARAMVDCLLSPSSSKSEGV